jgi:tetratricopeptide (TPR) repeat protein
VKHLVISVHGIRTFGNWQERLEAMLRQHDPSPELKVINYKYGYFSIFAFMMPFLRGLVVRSFRKSLIREATSQNWDRIDLVGHSFGTHIIAWAIYGIDSVKRPQVNTIVLAGSVLKTNFPWQVLIGHGVGRVVNDCGTKDAILVLNQIVVLGTGMAGRLGFTGGVGRVFRNRFFAFGHSGYFLTAGDPDDSFMQRYWLPLLTSDTEPELKDERTGGALSGVALWLLNNAEPIKIVAYVAPIAAFATYFYVLKNQARDNLLTSETLLAEFSDVIAEKVRPTAKLGEVDALLTQTGNVIAVAQQSDPRIAESYASILLIQAEIKFENGRIVEMRDPANQAIAVLSQSYPKASQMQQLLAWAEGLLGLSYASIDLNAPEVQHLLAHAEGWIGLSYAASDRDKARDYYGKAIDKLQELEKRFDAGRHGDNDWRWLRSLAGIQEGMGDLLLNQYGDVEQAGQFYQKSIATWTKLKRLRPDDPQNAYELAWAQNKRGDVFEDLGDDNQALQLFQAAEREIKPLTTLLAIDQRWLHFLSIAQNNVGLRERAKEQYEAAIKEFRLAAGSIEKLTLHDPNRYEWISTEAWTYDNIGGTQVRWAHAKGDASVLQGARDALKTALSLRTRVAENTDNPRYKIEPALSRASLAAYDGTEAELAHDCIAAAGDFDEAARDIASGIGDEREDDLLLDTAEYYEWAGVAYRNAGKKDDADTEFNRALRLVIDHDAKFLGKRKAFAAMIKRLEQELQDSSPPPGVCK